MFFHTSVLLKKVIEYLAPVAGGSYIDGTLGGGGYAEKILEASSPGGKLLGIDMDASAISAAREKLEKFGGRFFLKKANFSDIGILPEAAEKADGIVLDLGVSSCQLDSAERGFSFLKPAKLDMRMDKDSLLTAADVVNGSSCEELEKIFTEFGEERFAKNIAREVVKKRAEKRIEMTFELAEIVKGAYPAKARHGRIHPATKVFQALRIFVNGELENLKKFLTNAPALLNSGGRIVIISYHSLEDRIVKRKFKELAIAKDFKILTKKVVTADRAEILENRRARSAKLRAIMKI